MPLNSKKPAPTLIALIRSFRDLCQRREEEFCDRVSLTSSQFACLAAWPGDPGEVSIQRLADLLELSHSRSSRVADSMVEAGLLDRESLHTDRRLQVLSLTAKGRKKWQAVQGLLDECERGLRSQLNNQESEQVHGTLQLLIRNWQAHLSRCEKDPRKYRRHSRTAIAPGTTGATTAD